MIKYDNYNVELIVDLLKNNNIKDLVISPGGTHISLVKLVQNDNFFNCYSVVDERSAAYFAIGIYHETGNPVALLCTSAQATRNYVPGLTEAYYSNIPILAITMEKHPRFRYQGYMQQPDQISLPNDSVKKSFELPFVNDINDVYFSRRVANEAFLELSRNGLGPVQLCVPVLDFKIAEVEPVNRSIIRYNRDEIKSIDFKNKKILIVIGQHKVFTNEEIDAIDKFCLGSNTVIYTNHLSNFSNRFSVNGNLLISTIKDDEFMDIIPDVIISIGGQTGDYPLYLKLSKTDYSKIEHWIISEDGLIKDTYDKLTKVIQCSEYEFFKNVDLNNKVSHSYFKAWKEKVLNLKYDLPIPFSNTYIASYMKDKIPKNSRIQFSILNSLRVWNLFDLDSSIRCYSNVGAFGIDGGMSTLIGQSIVTNEFCFMIIGDLAFLYDINSISIRGIKNNLRIMIINNNGGIEFKLHGGNNEEIDKYIAASNHFKNAKGWAESCGFEYLIADNKEDFISQCNKFVSTSEKPIVFEVFVTDEEESNAYNSILDYNRKFTTKEVIKRSIKKIINKTKNK